MNDNYQGRLIRRPRYLGWSLVGGEWIIGGTGESRREVEQFPKNSVITPYGPPPRRPPADGRAG